MSTYFGNSRHMSAGYAMNRQFTGVTFSAALQDLRTSLWFGGADTLTAAQQVAAVARGEFKMVKITVTSGTVTSWLSSTPGDQKETATTTWGAQWLAQNEIGLSSFYLDTGGSPADFEVYVEFDLPRPGDVS